jgi:MFS transporter, MHS family, metabolite:H+ symporter
MTSPSMTANDRRPPFAIKSEITSADLRRGAWASLIGSALEYYDFALSSLASALIFGPLFFPSSNPASNH